MTGKDLKLALAKVQSTARLQFTKEAEEEVMIRLARILDVLRPKAWGNKTFDEEITLISDNEAVPENVNALAKEIEAIRQQQSPFVSA